MDITKQNTQADQAFLEFVRYTKNEFGPRILKDPDGFLDRMDVLQKLSDNHITSFLVFDATSNEIVFLGKNPEQMFGFSQEEISNLNLRRVFRSLHQEHLGFPLAISRWMQGLHEQGRASGRANLTLKHCSFTGLKIRNKQGVFQTISLRYIPVYTETDGFIPLALMLIHDITPYFKADFYWARTAFGEDGSKVAYFHSSGPTSKFQDIISEREKEILRLIAKGESSKDIAEKLFITVNTVDRHRKNMLAKTGAKNSTALLHICRLCDVVW